MNEKELQVLMDEGISGYNKIVYHFITAKDFQNAFKYADMKMEKIIDECLNMSDEDLSLIAYLYAMVGNFTSSRATLKVLYEDGDYMRDEAKLDLYGSLAAVLCHKKSGHSKKVKALLKQVLSFKPNVSHLGVDEILLAQAKEM